MSRTKFSCPKEENNKFEHLKIQSVPQDTLDACCDVQISFDGPEKKSMGKR
jgi:hypothetical protein